MSIIIQVADHILFEDNDILLINKPCSLMVEPDRNGHPNLLQQVQKYVKKGLHPNKEVYAQHIHRLDRPVSGIVLFAKKKSVLKNLSEQFAQRTVKKKYKALTEIQPALYKGTLNNWLYKDNKNKRAIIYTDPHPEADNVKLTYLTDLYKQFSLWDIDLHTGKYHQIRAQLAFAGCSIIGDATYGSTHMYAPNAIALHAYELAFLHPNTNEYMVVQAQPNWLV
jgi:RluA family pseudouridine synthase